MSAEELAARHAFEVEQRIKSVVLGMRVAWRHLAEDLYQFNQQRMWSDLGYGSFEEWLAGPEIDLQRRWVYELIAIWKELVIKAGADPEEIGKLEPSKLQELLPAVRRQQVTLERALADAGSLSRNDLRERYSLGGTSTTPTSNGSAPDDTTTYDAEAEPAYVRCPTCNSRVRAGDLRG